MNSPTSARFTSTAYAPSRTSRRRSPSIIILVLAIIAFVIYFSSSSISTVDLETAKASAKKLIPEKFPGFKSINSLAESVIGTQIQKDSSGGGTSWYSHWSWLKHPFSSSITQDENRLVLPPLAPRPPIYTFFDTDEQRTPAKKESEGKLIEIWRRAWWAQGFKPIVLGPAEALRSPEFQKLQGKHIDEGLETEILRWLAWAQVGGGILSNYLVIPMGPANDKLLTFLRSGDYGGSTKDAEAVLTRYEGMGNALYCGSERSVKLALQSVLESPVIEEETEFVKLMSNPDMFHVDPSSMLRAIAYYDLPAITKNYPKIAQSIHEIESRGLLELATLIESHLRRSFLLQNTAGINVLISSPERTTLLAAPAIALAQAINKCPNEPHQHSCPPNRLDCGQCSTVPLLASANINLDPLVYTIAGVPHPYTLTTLLNHSDALDVATIRRNTSRDPWMYQTTDTMMNKNTSAYFRIVRFKEKVASLETRTKGVYFPSEAPPTWEEMEWSFGFSIDPENYDSTPAATEPAFNIKTFPLPYPAISSTEPTYPPILSILLNALDSNPLKPSPEHIKVQSDLLSSSTQILRKAYPAGPDDFDRYIVGKVGIEPPANNTTDFRRVIEAWHLADMEAWRFVKALGERDRVERKKWVDEEHALGMGIGIEGVKAMGVDKPAS